MSARYAILKTRRVFLELYRKCRFDCQGVLRRIRLEILPLNTPRRVGSQSALNLTRLSPGDLIQARILSISAEGKTTLQMGPFRVQSDQSIAGKVGETLTFEVQHSTQPIKNVDQTRPSLSARQTAGAITIRPLSARIPSTLTIPMMTRAAANSTTTDLLQSAASNLTPDPSTPTLFEMVHARMLEPVTSIGGKWIRILRRRFASRLSRDTSSKKMSTFSESNRRRPVSAGESNHTLGTERGKADPLSDYSAGFWMDPSSDWNSFARINLRLQNENPSEADDGKSLTAFLMLELENTGVIEVELKMVADQIRVDFRVASEQMYAKLEAEMSGIYTSLKALAEGVYCRVRLDRDLVAPDPADNRKNGFQTEINLKI